ncbi:Exo-glucosaminidase LytG precursor [Clostridium homopropionicum DSM 5847]|uniref:Exo-glucosaminidase LytG n=1 Tax=Clostridium homopropionicum DSM 5847 TaxID=1121318 RepID=A0A0L6Z5L1_9CLOT|nr:glycoside hydrolase family 73 protein [Clostridium homopropionicum]KOA18250.1 Exo-glucosaminidase LytG precursor [Clostridium homopropionicum DSM 5847]SFF70552.1 Flagellum-specific peptidoglycan hydrolase FlgJ [Clostridium homopropionicum]
MSEQTDFIDKIKNGAIASMKKYGILASITIAQAILESRWGQSQLSIKAYNLFGIKAKFNEEYIDMRTTEYNSQGEKYYINAKFRKYNSFTESIEDHAEFLVNNTRYRINGFFDGNNYKEQAQALQGAGYATDPGYAKYLIRIIEQYKLDRYDVVSSTEKYTTPYCLEFHKWYNKVTETKAPLDEDNAYGINTANALKAITNYIKQSRKYKYCFEFQKFYNRVTQTASPLAEDGLYGPATEKALNIIERLIKGEY